VIITKDDKSLDLVVIYNNGSNDISRKVGYGTWPSTTSQSLVMITFL